MQWMKILADFLIATKSFKKVLFYLFIRERGRFIGEFGWFGNRMDVRTKLSNSINF